VSKPIAIIPNCAATRHVHFTLDGGGPAHLPVPNLNDWPKVTWKAAANARHVNLETITRDEIVRWKPGETLLLSGKILTGRDVAHKRIVDMLARGENLPPGVDLKNRFIYYVGPVNAVRDEAVGPAGPTTSTRMDKFTDAMLGKTGLLGMIGKAERGPQAIAAIKRHRAVYLIGIGGAAYLISKAIRSARVIAFEDLGMEAIHEFIVEDLPATVAVDANGESIHTTGPAAWQARIGKIPVIRN